MRIADWDYNEVNVQKSWNFGTRKPELRVKSCGTDGMSEIRNPKSTIRNELAICLVSGGMDSCVTAALAARENDELAFFHVNYGQRTEQRELRAFQEIGDFYNVKRRLVCNLTHLAEIGGSALTDRNIPVPEGKLERAEIPASYVPFRNANILSAAISWGEVLGAGRLYVGAVEEDSSGYPDCREQFFEAFEAAAHLGTKSETRIEICTPLIHMRKSEIVRRGVALNAPLHLSWSCYQGEDLACGQCDSCLLRLRGFREAGVQDPIPYRTRKL